MQRITGGKICDVVYDSVGKDTFPASLDCLRPLGMFVSFGQSSGPIPPFNLSMLSQKGSLFATRPTLFTYNAKREDLEALPPRCSTWCSSGAVRSRSISAMRCSDAARRMPTSRPQDDGHHLVRLPASAFVRRCTKPRLGEPFCLVPLKFLKLFQGACALHSSRRAYDAGGNTEHIRQTRWEAL